MMFRLFKPPPFSDQIVQKASRTRLANNVELAESPADQSNLNTLGRVAPARFNRGQEPPYSRLPGEAIPTSFIALMLRWQARSGFGRKLEID